MSKDKWQRYVVLILALLIPCVTVIAFAITTNERSCANCRDVIHLRNRVESREVADHDEYIKVLHALSDIRERCARIEAKLSALTPNEPRVFARKELP